ncbi:ABC transporter ATP-binding protein [Rhodoflexus caldus]|uniref:ABC transporter ATP-binding protein n=1 Tax=Rhodoflexus caldus TaxID=2891236 RepID=UPI002029E599|nr:ABC transporter ATP-binding protein [Rhodoflexus caldus]
MKVFWRILSFTDAWGRFLPFYMLVLLLSVVFGALNFSLLIPLFDVLFEKVPATATSLKEPMFDGNIIAYATAYFNYRLRLSVAEYGPMQSLQMVCAVLVVSVVLSNLFVYLAQYSMNQLCYTLIRDIRVALFERFTDLHLGYFKGEKKGDLLSRLTNDVQEVEVTVITVLKSIIKEPVTIIIFFGALLYLSVELTVFTLLFLPVSGAIIAEISKRLRREGRDRQDMLGKIVNIADEVLGGIKVVKAFNAVGYVNRKFAERNEIYRRLTISIENKRDLASPLSQVLGTVVVGGILLYGGKMVFGGELAASSFLTYIAFFTQILTPAKSVSTAVSTLQRGVASMERVLQVLDTQPAIQSAPDAQTIKGLEKVIEWHNVSFAYGERMVLQNINLRLEKGKSLALVGPSGGGKSTLADLLPRFYDPVQGYISIDGVDIRRIELQSLRNLFGIVTQEPILFNDTVFNNIAFGMPHATMEEVEKAARIANAHEFIMQLENGYDTLLGDRGGRLSGGQRQRISIARAVMKNPPILILDEATSALDSESEKAVQEALENVMQGRATLIIAHRLSTVQNADEIAVIQEGRIVEQGTHRELIALEGMYSKLTQLQTF